MLQSFAKSMSGFSPGEEARKVANGTWIHSLQSSLWNLRKRVREKDFTLWGPGRLRLLVFGYETETAKHLFVFKTHVLAARFSFPSLDRFKMTVGFRCIVLCYRNMDINRNTSAWCMCFLFCSLYIAICSLLAAFWITRRSDCLTQGQNFEVKKKKKCVFWYLELSLTAASLLAEAAQTTWNSFVFFFLSFIKLSLVCLNQKQILK